MGSGAFVMSSTKPWVRASSSTKLKAPLTAYEQCVGIRGKHQESLPTQEKIGGFSLSRRQPPAATNGTTQVKNSCVLTEALLQEEKKENLPQLKIVLDCKWRWGFSFAMLGRFFHVKQAVMNLSHYPSFDWVLYPEDVALFEVVPDVIRQIVAIAGGHKC